MGFIAQLLGAFGANSKGKAKPKMRQQVSAPGTRSVARMINRSSTVPRRGVVILYHGTPNLANAKSIAKHGFMVTGANGNALGDGIYLADLGTAKAYAGSSGYWLKCRVNLGKTCVWDDSLSKRYGSWCRRKGVTANNAAKTAFLLQNGYHTLQSGNVVVVLRPCYSNPTAYKRKDPRIRIVSVHSVKDSASIKV